MSPLELQDVHFAYGARDVLAGISLQLEAGQTVAIVGPNGSGKTTLLRVAGGVLEPSHGRVLLDGADLSTIPRRFAAQRLAAVPAEEEAVFPFTVRESVALGRHPWRGAFSRPGADDDAQIDRALAVTALTSLAARTLPALSSGERQRAAIARCLVQDAHVLLLDEPTSHLDLGQRQRVLTLLREEARTRQRAVALVLHDLNLAALAADRVLLLVDGRIAADGPPGEVLTAERIESAFDTHVQVLAHPETGAPVIVPCAAKGRA